MRSTLIPSSKLIALFLIGMFTCASVQTALTHPSASALSGSDFNAGRIIDDGIFFAPNDLSVQQIQQFLEAKVPSCDTNGTQPYAGTTAGAYGTSRGFPPPYTCLKDLYHTTVSKPAEAGLCNGYPQVVQKASEIIAGVAQSCGINPKVLIVLLQKEQGLVTDSWPWDSQYQKATGYGCPDTAPCNAQYYGFFNQLYSAARQFKNYVINSDSFNFAAYRNNNVSFNPSSSCGSTSLYINDPSTAALYNYTPYQPNQAALNNLYGTGDSCSAYGNRNFWRYYNDWFGSTQAFNANIILSKGLTTSSSGTAIAGDTVTASFEVTNTADYSTDAGGLGVCARMNGQYYDFGFKDQSTIPGHGKVTISYSKVLDRGGSLSLFICSYHASIGGWASAIYPYNTATANVRTATIQVQDNPLITSGVTFSPASPSIGQPVTATMTLRNASASDVNAGLLVVAARDSHGNNVDFPADPSVVIAANSTYTYSKTETFTTPGTYSFFVANLRNGVWDTTTYPKSADGTITRRGSLVVQDNPLVTSSVSLSPSNPSIGQPITATLSIRNTSASDVNIGLIVIASRDVNGYNADFPPDANITIPANSTYTYSKVRTMVTPGPYSFFVSDLRGSTWDRNYPKSLNDSILRSGGYFVQDNPLITSGVTFSPASPSIGQPVTATMTLRNASASDVNAGLLVVAARDSHGNNVDFPADPSVVIAANSTYTYSKTETFTTPGTYSFFVANLRNGVWDTTTYPKSADGTITRRGSLVVH